MQVGLIFQIISGTASPILTRPIEEHYILFFKRRPCFQDSLLIIFKLNLIILVKVLFTALEIYYSKPSLFTKFKCAEKVNRPCYVKSITLNHNLYGNWLHLLVNHKLGEGCYVLVEFICKLLSGGIPYIIFFKIAINPLRQLIQINSPINNQILDSIVHERTVSSSSVFDFICSLFTMLSNPFN